MVCFGGLEFLAAGYLIAEHNKKKKEIKRIEEEEALRHQAAQQSSHHHHHRRRRRHSDSEREDRQHRERAWAEPLPKKEPPRKQIQNGPQKPRKDKRQEDALAYGYRAASSSPAPRYTSPLPQKSHINRPYGHAPNVSSTYLAPPRQHPRSTRAGSDPPPNRLPSQHSGPSYQAGQIVPYQQNIPAHQQIHNSIFPTVPPQLYRSSPLSHAILPAAVVGAHPNPPYPTYHPPTPPSPPPPASALSSRPHYTTPPLSTPISLLPPPPEGVWELPASDGYHPNPGRRRASSTNSRPHVRFADGLDVHENISDPPPPYQEF